MSEKMRIEVRNLKRYFSVSDRLTVQAVDDVTFGIKAGEVFGLMGETGCGKSTLARVLAGIYKPTAGQVLYEGVAVSGEGADKEQASRLQGDMQIIFQDSAAALNPRMNVEEIILEPLRIQKGRQDKELVNKRLLMMLERTGLAASHLGKLPSELSGGQRQRVAIARSLMTEPKLIIADEPVASLDISIQAQILKLFQELQQEHGFSLLFIAHDLNVIRFISHRAGVMFRGKMVEMGETAELFQSPGHPYTQALLSAIHIADPVLERRRKILDYDPEMELGAEMKVWGPGHLVLA